MRESRTRRTAGFAQPFGVPADAGWARGSEDRHMLLKSPIVDLADRRTSDLEVVLLWSRRSGRVWVNVTHRRSGRTARIEATPANALEVFEHPFAYAEVAA